MDEHLVQLRFRQLMRKWGGLSNTGSSGFNRDISQHGENIGKLSGLHSSFGYCSECILSEIRILHYAS